MDTNTTTSKDIAEPTTTVEKQAKRRASLCSQVQGPKQMKLTTLARRTRTGGETVVTTTDAKKTTRGIPARRSFCQPACRHTSFKGDWAQEDHVEHLLARPAIDAAGRGESAWHLLHGRSVAIGLRIVSPTRPNQTTSTLRSRRHESRNRQLHRARFH